MLSQADFAMVRMTLEFLEPCRLDPFALLRLRRGLLRSGRELFGDRACQWFSPPLSCDPQALRRFQKPAPAFVLRPQLLKREFWDEGDTLSLEILFLGVGIQQLPGFISLLKHLGRSGLDEDGGCFDLVSVDCLGASGTWHQMSHAHAGGEPSPDVLSVGWWLDSYSPLPEPLHLSFSTPTRLVVNGHSLRRPQFRQIFPFMLRRVTSMLYYHCGLEPVEDLIPLFSMAKQVCTDWETSRWIDWHDLGDESKRVRVGGVTGQLRLSGKGHEELDWIVALSTLFGVGRGASFGAGRLDLVLVSDPKVL